MRKYLVLATVIIMAATLMSCRPTNQDATRETGNAATSAAQSARDIPLSLVSLPAAGHIYLDPVNPSELEHIGLGGPAPLNAPPYTPYDRNGMFWSEPFSLTAGDKVQITVDSDSPVSWFGVDWSNYDVRGILASTEVDEDGRAFDPQYPANSHFDRCPDSYKLVVNYHILYDTDCVLVIKNANPDKSQRLSMAVSLRPAVSLKRIIRSIPVLKNIVTPDHDDMEE